jgi:hypothetical protein
MSMSIEDCWFTWPRIRERCVAATILSIPFATFSAAC